MHCWKVEVMRTGSNVTLTLNYLFCAKTNNNKGQQQPASYRVLPYPSIPIHPIPYTHIPYSSFHRPLHLTHPQLYQHHTSPSTDQAPPCTSSRVISQNPLHTHPVLTCLFCFDFRFTPVLPTRRHFHYDLAFTLHQKHSHTAQTPPYIHTYDLDDLIVPSFIHSTLATTPYQ